MSDPNQPSRALKVEVAKLWHVAHALGLFAMHSGARRIGQPIRLESPAVIEYECDGESVVRRFVGMMKPAQVQPLFYGTGTVDGPWPKYEPVPTVAADGLRLNVDVRWPEITPKGWVALETWLRCLGDAENWEEIENRAVAEYRSRGQRG